MHSNPLDAPKGELAAILERISVADSPVGIDAQYTHAVIIAYLQRIDARLDALESALGNDPR